MTRLLYSLLIVLTIVSLAHGEPSSFAQALANLEKENGGRLGVAALNTADGQWLEYRASERFALASTFKVLLAAAVLSRVDAGQESLSRMVPFDASDLLSYAPVTSKQVTEGGMSVSALCAAAIEMSDNTAANLLLKSLGGPEAVTKFVRSLDDEVTRLDRNEPSLNSNLPGDERDTTTPKAMTATLQKLLVGNALTVQSRKQLADWMIACLTGDAKLRAGLDPSWKVGDKTGSGENGASNDVAIVWPADGAPFLIAVYYTGASGGAEKKNSVIEKVGRAVAATFHPSRSR